MKQKYFEISDSNLKVLHLESIRVMFYQVGESPSPNPDMLYRKDLCVYKAGTREETDESIEIIKSFMAGTYDETPSKFDDL